jgi:hypothetical protein
LEEFNKYYQARPAPVKSRADEYREFLAEIFENATELSVEKIKELAAKDERRKFSEDEFSALREIAHREGYTGGRYGYWCDPLKKQTKAGEVQ